MRALKMATLILLTYCTLQSNGDTLADGTATKHANNVNQNELIFSGLSDSAFNVLCKAIIEEAYARIGRRANVVLLPGKRRLSMTANGELDGDINLTKRATKIYPELIRVDVPYMSLNWHLYVRSEFKEKASGLPLERLRLGVLRGLLFTNELTKGMQPVEANGVSQLFKLLTADRVDAVIFTAFTGDTVLTSHFSNHQIARLNPAISTEPVFHYLQRAHANLVPEITQSLQGMIDSGRIREIKDQVRAKLANRNRESYDELAY